MSKISELLDKKPEILVELQEFYTQELLTSIEHSKEKIPESFSDMLKEVGVTREVVIQKLEFSPRVICDFMDSKGIIILPTFSQGAFSYTIDGEPCLRDFPTRFRAEEESVVSSVEYYLENTKKSLEENLSNEKKDIK